MNEQQAQDEIIRQANIQWQQGQKRAAEKADRLARFAATTEDMSYEERAMSANLHANGGA